MNGRHRGAEGDHRGRRAPYVASGTILLVLLALGTWVAVDRVGCLRGGTSLRVAAVPEVASVIREVSAAHEGLRCVDVEVDQLKSADVAERLASPGAPPGGRPHVWIPESSAWVGVARNSAQGSWLLADPDMSDDSIASSPLVIVMPRAAAERAGWPEATFGWASLIPTNEGSGAEARPQLRMLDPTRNAAGLLTLLGLQRAVAAADSSTVAGVVRTLANATVPTEATLYTTFEQAAEASDSWVSAVVSEQSVWQYNEGRSAARAVAIYPRGGTFRLDYPYALVNGPSLTEEVRSAAEELRAALRSEAGRETIRTYGFRTPDGAANPRLSRARGLTRAQPELLAAPGAAAVVQAREGWRRLTLDIRTLVLFDISGSMTATVPGTSRSRMEETIATAVRGLELFPPGTEIGLWAFSTDLADGKDYEELVPIGPISDNRARMRQAMTSLRPEPGGDTGLYDSILAAYRAVDEGYDPNMVNSVIVLTDGKNDDADSISLDRLLDRIGEMQAPDMTIPVISIAFGPGIDPDALRKIGAATGGEAYVTRDAAEIQKVFLEAISQRTCRPNCPEG